jgi:hypothetical protein
MERRAQIMVEDIGEVAVELDLEGIVEGALERREEWIAEQVIEAYDDGKDYLDVLTETGVMTDPDGIRDSPIPTTYANATNEDKPNYAEEYRVERYYLNKVDVEKLQELRNEVTE